MVALGGGEAPAQKKTLVVGMASSDAGKLAPHLTATTPDKGVLNRMFNDLVCIPPGRANPELPEPDLAESWESRPDALTSTFISRRGAECHHRCGESAKQMRSAK